MLLLLSCSFSLLLFSFHAWSCCCTARVSDETGEVVLSSSEYGGARADGGDDVVPFGALRRSELGYSHTTIGRCVNVVA